MDLEAGLCFCFSEFSHALCSLRNCFILSPRMVFELFEATPTTACHSSFVYPTNTQVEIMSACARVLDFEARRRQEEKRQGK